MGRKRREIDDIEDFDPGDSVDAEEETPESKHSSPLPEEMFPALPSMPLPSKVTQLSKKNEVIRQDAEVYHAILTGLAYQWSQANSVDEVCKLALTTDKIIMGRRRALLLPYAAAPTEESDDRYVLPLD